MAWLLMSEFARELCNYNSPNVLYQAVFSQQHTLCASSPSSLCTVVWKLFPRKV